MTSLEVMRARKLLAGYCAQRNALSPLTGVLRVNDNGSDSLLVSRIAGAQAVADSEPLLRLEYRDDAWWLSWPTRDGQWQPYAPLPRAGDIESVIAELEQAPLHVHWA